MNGTTSTVEKPNKTDKWQDAIKKGEYFRSNRKTGRVTLFFDDGRVKQIEATEIVK